jgi:hypothetical protein
MIQVEQYAYVFGSREIKEMLLRNKKLKPRLQTEDLYHSFNNQTIHDNYFSQLMTIETNDDNKINEIVDLINKGMAEYLLFTLEEINQSINDVDYILIIDNQIDKELIIDKSKCVNIDRSHKLYERLCNYKIFGKLYIPIVNYDINDFIDDM